MSEISDELRDWCDRNDENGCGGFVTEYSFEDICDLADRIDRELVELPKDAHGEYIHVGDVMEERSGHTFEVASLMAFGGSDNWLVLSDARNFSSFREPHDLRHYHEPTVEDVLREFTDEVWNRCCEGATASDSGIDELVAECAAKLRLAGENA